MTLSELGIKGGQNHLKARLKILSILILGIGLEKFVDIEVELELKKIVDIELELELELELDKFIDIELELVRGRRVVCSYNLFLN